MATRSHTSYRRIYSRSAAAKLADRILETPFMSQIIRLARGLGWGYWHDDATSVPRVCRHCRKPLGFKRNRRGFPDLVLIRDDVLIFAEIKKADGARSDDQVAWGEALQRVRKIAYYVWRPADAERIARILGA